MSSLRKLTTLTGINKKLRHAILNVSRRRLAHVDLFMLPLLPLLLLFLPCTVLAATITLLRGDPSLNFTDTWSDRIVNDTLFRITTISGQQLVINLPQNATGFNYTGLKTTTPSLYGVCIDTQCNGNVVNSTDAVPSIAQLFFNKDLDPTVPHTVFVSNRAATGLGAITFVSVTVTTLDVGNATAPIQNTPTTQSEQHSISSIIIVLTILGSVSLLVGLIIFLHSVRRQRLKLMQRVDDESDDFDKNQLFSTTATMHQYQDTQTTVTRLGSTISSKPTLVSSATLKSTGRSLSSSHKSLPKLPPLSRPPSVIPPLPVARPRDTLPRETTHSQGPIMFRASFLDFEDKSDSGQSVHPPPSRFSFSTTAGH